MRPPRRIEALVGSGDRDRPLHVIVGATRLQVFGEGEWAAAKWGGGRRGWKKLHIAVGGDGRILSAEVIPNEIGDAQVRSGRPR